MAQRTATFQCSSASRKFLNILSSFGNLICLMGFSALQRAENSSMRYGALFWANNYGFSALQRAENSSMIFYANIVLCRWCFSALQRAENSSIIRACQSAEAVAVVSVLFSEPKIPQSSDKRKPIEALARFQCSSASRKFLNRSVAGVLFGLMMSFSALQRAENSSIDI